MRKTFIRKLQVVLLLGITVLTGCASTESEVGILSSREAYQWLADSVDAIVLDVRSEEEFLTGHIEGAILLPLPEIETQAAERLLDKDALILVVCQSGNRSQVAAQQLVDLGYTNVYNIGGVLSWPGELVR